MSDVLDAAKAAGPQLSTLKSQIYLLPCKHILHEPHVAQGAQGHGEEHLPFPEMHRHREDEGDGLRNAVGAFEEGYVLQAVHHKKGENRRRQGFPQVFHIRRQPAAGLEDDKWQEPGNHGACSADEDRGHLLPEGHIRHKKPPAFSMGLRSTVRAASMPTMAGMIKLSAPKIRRLPMENTKPMRAV